MKLVEKEMTVKQKEEEEAITYTMMAEPKVKVTSQYALSKFSGNDLYYSSRKTGFGTHRRLLFLILLLLF